MKLILCMWMYIQVDLVLSSGDFNNKLIQVFSSGCALALQAIPEVLKNKNIARKY